MGYIGENKIEGPFVGFLLIPLKRNPTGTPSPNPNCIGVKLSVYCIDSKSRPDKVCSLTYNEPQLSSHAEAPTSPKTPEPFSPKPRHQTLSPTLTLVSCENSTLSPKL